MKKNDNKLRNVTGLMVVMALVMMIKFGSLVSGTEKGWSDPKAWVDFGTFMGGALGPIFAFLGIAYMAWSVKEQGEMFQKQLKEDRRKDECSMLLHEINIHLANIEKNYGQPAELQDVAKQYVTFFWGKDTPFESKDRYVIKVNGDDIQGEVFPLLSSLQSEKGVNAVKEFIKTVKKSVFIFPLIQCRSSVMIVTKLLLEAHSLGLSASVTRSYVARCKNVSQMLYVWGELPEQFFNILNCLELLPIITTDSQERLTALFVNVFNQHKKTDWCAEDVDIDFKKMGNLSMLFLKNKSKGITWVLDNNEGWKEVESTKP